MSDVMAVPRPGEVFAGKYLIERMVGSGKNSLVFVAQHGVTGKRFAIEWLVPKSDYARHDALIDEDEEDTNATVDAASVSGAEVSEVRDAAAFVSEAEDFDTSAQQVVGHFRHPNVLEVYDVGETAGSLYTVMEWSEGESLEVRIARTGPLSIADACQLLVPCMRGLHEAHDAGIVHCDLKPSNIFVCQAARGGPEVAKVLDFELVSEQSGNGDPSALVLWRGSREGKPYYRAPEQLGGLPVDRRTDVYGFGAILYEVLTGRPPFAPVSYSNANERARIGNPALRSRSERLPRGADAIVGRAMARDAAKRFQTLHELADAFEALSHSPVAFSQSTLTGSPSFDAEPLRRVRTASPPPFSSSVATQVGDATAAGARTNTPQAASATGSRPWPRPTRSEASDEPTVPESAWQEAPDWSDPRRTSHVPEWSQRSPGPHSSEPSGAAYPRFHGETAFPSDSVYAPYRYGPASGPGRFSGATALLGIGAFCFVGMIGFMAYEEWSSRRGDYLRSIEVSSSAPPRDIPPASPPVRIAEAHVPAPAVEAPLPRGVDPDPEPEPEEPLAAVEVPPSPDEHRARAIRPSNVAPPPRQPSGRSAEPEPSMDRPRPPAQSLNARPRVSAARESRPPMPAQSDDPADLLPMHLM